MVRSLSETVVAPAFHLTADWANAPDGKIPRPSDADRVLPATHAALFLKAVPDTREFYFQLKWPHWGDGGRGYMPYEYFDRYVIECWATYVHPTVLKLYKLKAIEKGKVRWSAHDEEDHRIYGYEIRNSGTDERHGWTFVVERDGALEVEELYVRPEFRRLGHGRWLADRVVELARAKGMPVRLWVAFADCKLESEGNHPALVAIAGRLGVQFQLCPVPWAAYFGTTETKGEPYPVEPTTIPARPRTPWTELLATMAALGVGQGNSGVPTVPAVPSVPAVTASEDSNHDFPEVGTEAWGQMNRRRAELIRKKNRGGLDPSEQNEYEDLQRRSQAALERAFPAPTRGEEDLARLKARLNGTTGADAE